MENQNQKEINTFFSRHSFVVSFFAIFNSTLISGVLFGSNFGSIYSLDFRLILYTILIINLAFLFTKGYIKYKILSYLVVTIFILFWVFMISVIIGLRG